MHSYYAVFSDITNFNPVTDDADDFQVATDYQSAYGQRTLNETYMMVAMKRGDYMEHYIKVGTSPAVLTDTVNVVSHSSKLAASWADIDGLNAFFATGHSAYGSYNAVGNFSAIPPDEKAVVDMEEIEYGFLKHHFLNATPSQKEIRSGMDWMRSRWIAGNKAIYPGWMF